MTLIYAEETYTRHRLTWYDKDGLEVCQAVAQELNRRWLERWWGENEAKFNPGKAIKFLSQLRRYAEDVNTGAGKHWAEAVGRRLLQQYPDNPYLATILCSALRSEKQPAEAIKLGTQFLKPGPSPLRTTLAAALCDLKQWQSASTLLGNTTDSFSLAVKKRIDQGSGS